MLGWNSALEEEICRWIHMWREEEVAQNRAWLWTNLGAKEQCGRVTFSCFSEVLLLSLGNQSFQSHALWTQLTWASVDLSRKLLGDRFGGFQKKKILLISLFLHSQVGTFSHIRSGGREGQTLSICELLKGLSRSLWACPVELGLIKWLYWF